MPNYQPSISVLILKYITTNHPDLPSNNFQENISPKISNNGKKKIKPADIMNNNNENSRLMDIN